MELTMTKASGYIPEDSEMESRVDDFLSEYQDHPHIYMARQIAATALKLLSEDVDSEEWRVATIALKEMRHAFRVFAPYEGRKKVTVFGSARSKPESAEYIMAKELAERLSALEYMVITGAGPGVMEGANAGAGRENSFGLNVEIPWEQQANPFIDGDEKLIDFHYFFTRKLFFVKESDALVLFPGGYGTMDEAFETLVLIHTGKTPIKPIIMVDDPQKNFWTKWLRFIQSSQLKNGYINKEDLYLWTITYDVKDAVKIIQNFYRNYHSQRWVGDQLVIRITRELNETELKELNEDFAEIITSGKIEQQPALEAERQREGDIPFEELPRLVLNFDKVNYGRLRQMVDVLNSFR
jgi:uncharacterized protein (TIGR00730 family)